MQNSEKINLSFITIIRINIKLTYNLSESMLTYRKKQYLENDNNDFILR